MNKSKIISFFKSKDTYRALFLGFIWCVFQALAAHILDKEFKDPIVLLIGWLLSFVSIGAFLIWLYVVPDWVIPSIGAELDTSRCILKVELSTKKLKKGDIFLWQSANSGQYEIHTFHSDAGYGAKTFTNYNEKDGSSVLVNYSGICGVIEAGLAIDKSTLK